MNETMNITKTNNYDIFKLVKENRNIDSNHVKRLKKSIQENNLLKIMPIVVDHNMTVIDGQHRLAVAKELNVPIYYVSSDVNSIETITTLNTTSKNWTLLDFAKAYSKMGKKSYDYVLDLCEELSINISLSLQLLTQKMPGSSLTTNNSPAKLYKEGKIKISLADFLQAKSLGSKIFILDDYVQSCRSRTFVSTMIKLLNNPKFDFDRFVKQLETHGKKIRRRESRTDYLRDIEDIYNFKRTEKHKVRLYE